MKEVCGAVSYDVGSFRALLDGLEEEARGSLVIFLDETAVGQHRREMVTEYTPE